MKVSVICPTRNRHDRHELLYRAFTEQKYKDSELLILDDSTTASPFFVKYRDERVTYMHIHAEKSVGQKRNYLNKCAKGQVIAHFDDDDYYAPTYLESMLEVMGSASFVKLSKWLAWWEKDGTFWEWDTTMLSDLHFVICGDKPVMLRSVTLEYPSEEQEVFLKSTLWGFGFSFVYLKSLWEKSGFPNLNFGEDYAFVQLAARTGETLIHTSNYPHIALHTIHADNVSKILPQRRLTMAEGIELLGQGVLPWLRASSTESPELPPKAKQ